MAKAKKAKKVYCVQKGKRKVSCHRKKSLAKRAQRIHGGKIVHRRARRKK